ncbi:SDR family NAD(P)-dependent oxidoreductase [Flavobacterium chuncheonense]|uniref:SDR family NAD(P)-dependent oxidoreductase n=1 Tax=Flavobacterium chuncheonense TaxID=2026653 RepID=A0ABW5YMS1_9FLAO
MTKIAILGCGWLGLPLASQLINNGFYVKGSTTTATKLPLLAEKGIVPFQIALSESEIAGPIHDFLNDTEILIVDIPPKLRSENGESFIGKMQLLISEIENHPVKKILFISSTSVYADTFPIEEITETSKRRPDTESGKQLTKVEDLLLSNQNFQTTILRFGGLIGEKRHPVHFLAGKENVANPDAPINLIHQEDCITIIQSILKKDIWNTTFNAVAPQHPTRKAYYTFQAEKLNLEAPKFNAEGNSIGKLILSDKVTQELDYQFSTNLL